MKKIFSYVVASVMAFLTLSCDNEWDPEKMLEPKGELLLSSISIDVDTEEDVLNRAVTDISNYMVNIYNADNQPVANWTYAEMPEVVSLNVGEYTIEVKSHQLQSAEWERPYYYGSKSFKIEKSKVTEPGDIVCKFSNVKVSVAYSEALEAALGNDVIVNILVGESSLDYVKGEQRAGYFALPSSSSTIIATFTGSVNGNAVSLRKTFTNIETGQHHIITFSLTTGTANPDIVVDADITDDDVNVDVPGEDTEIPGGDRPGDGEDSSTVPTVTSETLNLDGVNIVADDLVAKVDINVPKGVETFVVEIISEQLSPEVLTEVGLAARFDLANPGDLNEALIELGFPTGENVIGKQYLPFDISQFMPLLAMFPGTHQFRLIVTDTLGQSVTKTLTFQVVEQ